MTPGHCDRHRVTRSFEVSVVTDQERPRAREDVIAWVIARLLLGVALECRLRCEHGVDRDPLNPLGLLRVESRRAGSLATQPLEQPARNHKRPSDNDRWKWRELPFLVELGCPTLEPRFEFVGSLSSTAGVHLRLLSGEFLFLQLEGAVVPVLDLVRQPAVNRLACLLDARVGLLA